MPTRDPAAYNLYLRGVGAANTFSESGIRRGLDYLNRAIALDTAFADAYVQVAVAWGLLADGYIEGRVGYARAREAAAQALRLDSSLATAHGILAASAIALDADAADARRWALRAQSLEPRSWLAHVTLSWAWFLSGTGEDSALAEARQGWEADTLSAVSGWNYLLTLTVLRRADALAAVLPRMENVLGPEDLRTFDGVVRLERGDSTATERLSWSYYGGVLAAEYVRAQLALGRRDVARAAVDSMVALSRRGYYNAFSVARAHAALGDPDAAFAWLDRAWAQRTNWLVFVRSYAEFASLHSDPRWAAFLSRMGVRS
jgi:tetratricopeptide (TPR) repeat protein